MWRQTVYLLDSDIFIAAKNSYFAFDLCPGFWKSLLHFHREGRVFSVDRVRTELLAARLDEDLVQWVKNDVPKGFFLSTEPDDVARVFSEIMRWVHRHPNYLGQAMEKFAKGADGWLVACAKVRGATVVTNEKPAPQSKKHVKLPDVCDEFSVPQKNTFGMLRALGAQFDWTVDVG